LDFGAALASAAQALKIAKQLREIEGGMDVAELKTKIADLYINVAEVRMALADAQEVVRAKDAEIAALKKHPVEGKPMIEANAFQYEEVGGNPKGLPYCPNCLFKAVQVRPVKVLHGFQCPRCKSHFSHLVDFN
jgi:Zn finger protein HypA/HybF involved in hydrogenase expression